MRQRPSFALVKSVKFREGIDSKQKTFWFIFLFAFDNLIYHKSTKYGGLSSTGSKRLQLHRRSLYYGRKLWGMECYTKYAMLEDSLKPLRHLKYYPQANAAQAKAHYSKSYKTICVRFMCTYKTTTCVFAWCERATAKTRHASSCKGKPYS